MVDACVQDASAIFYLPTFGSDIQPVIHRLFFVSFVTFIIDK
ncbi:hypothetical protein BLGI_261 [Brevibacillus laterosporus GI-9]|nr:hypothetical protein BLGI_261 [Brevibacillus laterosporus GI-9]